MLSTQLSLYIVQYLPKSFSLMQLRKFSRVNSTLLSSESNVTNYQAKKDDNVDRNRKRYNNKKSSYHNNVTYAANNNFGNINKIEPYMNENRIYGIHPVLLSLQANKRKFYHLYYTSGKNRMLLNDILAASEERNITATEVDTQKMLELLGPQRTHQGVCLIASALPTLIYDNCETKFEDWLKEKVVQKPFKDVDIWLYLDQIVDPQNFGAIIRTACYFGIEHILTGVKHRCSITNTASKASSGTAETTAIIQILDSLSAIESLKAGGWEIVVTATSDTKGCIRIDQYQPGQKLLLILGNEGSGVTPKLRALATSMVTITGKSGSMANSLNVSAATSILLHSITKNFI